MMTVPASGWLIRLQTPKPDDASVMAKAEPTTAPTKLIFASAEKRNPRCNSEEGTVKVLDTARFSARNGTSAVIRGSPKVAAITGAAPQSTSAAAAATPVPAQKQDESRRREG